MPSKPAPGQLLYTVDYPSNYSAVPERDCMYVVVVAVVWLGRAESQQVGNALGSRETFTYYCLYLLHATLN